MLPLTQFLSFVKHQHLFNAEDKVLLAVSGGKDSVLMAHLFNAAKLNFGIAHCNFKLREEESNGDAKFTEELAKSLKVPFFSTCFNTTEFARESKLSIQMAARELRYNWFESLRKDHNFQYIALAHHQNDTVETILLNLVRGTGIAGLHGILPKRGNLIRPLLFLKRDEIDHLVDENQLVYCEDSSNSSAKYARNKIRLEVLPKLKELNPLLENTFEKNSQRFKELEDFLNMQTEALREKVFKNISDGEVQIALEDLKSLKPQKLLLYELFKPFNFSETVLEDLVQSWAGQPGKKFESPTHRLLLDRKVLVLTEINNLLVEETIIAKGAKEFSWGKHRFTVITSENADLEISGSKNTAWFDEELLHFPLKLRHWNKGDYFVPFGMKGKKKLSDYFTSIKLPLTEKKKIPVLENGNGDILWVPGYRSDERYKVSKRSKKVIIFEQQTRNDN